MRHFRNIALGVTIPVLICFFGEYSSVKAAAPRVVFPVEDTEAALHNPEMGWVLCENYIISKNESAAVKTCPTYGYTFPGVDSVMLKFTWADIEKSEGGYDFSEFDYIRFLGFAAGNIDQKTVLYRVLVCSGNDQIVVCIRKERTTE